MKLKEIRRMVGRRLQRAGIEAWDHEAWLLMEWKLSLSRAEYYQDPDLEIPEEKMRQLTDVLLQREARVPLQYLTGTCDFMGYSFRVKPGVLIPRQDTECLVEEVCRRIREDTSVFRVLDLCTGSGCIGISIKLLCPKTEVVLTDLSREAVDLAVWNSRKLSAEVTVLQGDLFRALDSLSTEERRFDLIVSNPPYIPSGEVEELMPEVRDHEPRMALDGRKDGLAFYRAITAGAPEHLREGGSLFYEIGAEQAGDVSAIMRKAGFRDVSVGKDLAGLDRTIRGRLS